MNDAGLLSNNMGKALVGFRRTFDELERWLVVPTICWEKSGVEFLSAVINAVRVAVAANDKALTRRTTNMWKRDRLAQRSYSS